MEDDVNQEPNIEAVKEDDEIIFLAFYQPPMPESLEKEGVEEGGIYLSAMMYNLSVMLDGVVIRASYLCGLFSLSWSLILLYMFAAFFY